MIIMLFVSVICLITWGLEIQQTRDWPQLASYTLVFRAGGATLQLGQRFAQTQSLIR